MTRGRKKKLPIEPLRSRWWYERIAYAAACKTHLESLTPYGLDKLFRDEGVWATSESRQWYYYQKGDRSPLDSVLNAVDNYLPGTRQIFDNGPDFSYLWEALSGNPQHALNRIEEEWRKGTHVEHLFSLPNSTPFDEHRNLMQCSGQIAIQDLVVPRRLANRLGIRAGARLNLADKLQPWERLQDVTGTRIFPHEWEQGSHHVASVLLNVGPAATGTIEERSMHYPQIQLPYFAGLSYLIAQARLDGQNEVALPVWYGWQVMPELGNVSASIPANMRQANEAQEMLWKDLEEVSGLSFRRHFPV